jgi:hypothetical protein
VVRKYIRDIDHSRERKPTFNVVKPFQGITTIQVNSQMRQEITRFMELFEGDSLESDLIDLTDALTKVDSGTSINYNDPDSQEYDRSMYVSPEINGVSSIQMNESARQLLIEVVQDCEGGVDKIIWALRLALEDPTGGPRDKKPKPYFSKRKCRT